MVTGLGIVSPIGNSVDEAWPALVAGDGGAGPISRFDASDFPVRFACEVQDFEVGEFVDAKAARRMDRCSQLLLGAARQAERDSGLELARLGKRAGTARSAASPRSSRRCCSWQAAGPSV